MTFKKTVFIGVDVTGQQVTLNRCTGWYMANNLPVGMVQIPSRDENGEIRKIETLHSGAKRQENALATFTARFISPPHRKPVPENTKGARHKMAYTLEAA